MRSADNGLFSFLSRSLRSLFMFLLSLVLLGIFLLMQFASAQQTLGSLNGTVTDASGAVVQGAGVKARPRHQSRSDRHEQVRRLFQHRRPAHRHLRSHVRQRWIPDCGLPPNHRPGQPHRNRECQLKPGDVS